MSTDKSKSILVVNGEPEIADLFAEMLLMDIHSYIVTTTFSGKGCLSGIKKNKPDLVLIDIELPDADGWDLIGKIKENNPDMPVVVITSKIPRINEISRLSLVSDYLMKPVTLDCLHMAVKDALEIPPLIEQCVKKFEGGKEEYMKYFISFLLKQHINNRKRFILMRQLYPDRELEKDPEGKQLLDNLREKINSTHSELKQIKNYMFLAA